ncbi:MAG TPA: cupredoxin domain-containing protein [Nitrososphaera sp.]|jgi:plastocyanin
MVWKIVLLSISIVIGSSIIAGAIVVTQVLSASVDLADFGDDDGFGNAGQDSAAAATIPTNATIVSIVADAGSDSYDPNPVEIGVGETVAWQNDDDTVHTATSNDGTFDSKMLRRGEVFSFTFEEEGEFPYYCNIHPNMKGTVVV